jgi:hypothetical protein
VRSIERLRHLRPSTLAACAAAAFVAAGGVIHLREWLETYRHVPAGLPGAAVVRVGFPSNAAVSAVLAVALLVACTRVGSRFVMPLLGATILFEIASLATLIATRTGSVLGWSEPDWSRGAEQTRAAEIGALVALGAMTAVLRLQRQTRVAPLRSARC